MLAENRSGKLLVCCLGTLADCNDEAVEMLELHSWWIGTFFAPGKKLHRINLFLEMNQATVTE